MRTWLGISACLLAAGCVSTSVQRLDLTARPARPPDAVTVLLEAPPRPFTVIAVLESRGETVFDGPADLRKKMLLEAARLGGEALILGRESTDSEFVFTGLGMIQSDRKRMTGVVIAFDPRS
jgi:hypothetical protein